jgi:hypothetical protein
MQKPAWAENVDLTAMHRIWGDRVDYVLWHLHWYAVHYNTAFDVTFHDREPLLEVTLDRSYAQEFCATLVYGGSALRLIALFKHVRFADGTSVCGSQIWTINYMPPDLDPRGVDMAQAEEVIGFSGETLREIVRNTYRCKTRAEEDHFIARWIAS